MYLVWVCTIVLLYYVCASHVCLGMVLKGSQNNTTDHNFIVYLIDCVCSIDSCAKGLKLMQVNIKKFNN